MTPTFGDEPHMYICEIKKLDLDHIILGLEARPLDYGYEIVDPLKIPHGPYFIEQPTNKVFDLAKRGNLNYIELR